MKPLFTPASAPEIPIQSTSLQHSFPVRRIYCVGRNYVEHAQEMGHSGREAPFFFSKPADALVINPSAVQYPLASSELHHEVELVIALQFDSHDNARLSLEQAQSAIYGVALGVDFTKRDVQAAAKSKGRPWDLAKGFDQSAPISTIVPIEAFEKRHEDLQNCIIELSVDGELRQHSHTSAMIWSCVEVVAELSQHINLQSGDLIYTGTPSGVAAIKAGQQLSASLTSKSLASPLTLDFKMSPRKS